MSRSLVDERYEHGGVQGLALTGDRLRLTLFPEAGAKIYNLVHAPSGVDLLWQNPRVPLARTYPGPAFDDVWCGGWDELFPTDAPCALGENTFPDHGDLWCGPWSWEVEHDDGDEATVHLARYGVSLPCLMEKWITVRRDEPTVDFRHRLTSLGTQRVPFVWNLHVAHAVAASSRIHLPAAAVATVPAWEGRFAGLPTPLSWPLHAGVDVAEVPGDEQGVTEWLYPRELRDGWCAVTHPHAGVGLGLSFDPVVFPTVWLWGVYGGWRGHHVLLTEPATGPPGNLAESVARGTAAWIEPGAVLETRVVATVLDVAEQLPGDVRPDGLTGLER